MQQYTCSQHVNWGVTWRQWHFKLKKKKRRLWLERIRCNREHTPHSHHSTHCSRRKVAANRCNADGKNEREREKQKRYQNVVWSRKRHHPSKYVSLTEAGSGTEKGVHLLSGLCFADRWEYIYIFSFYSIILLQHLHLWSESIYPSNVFQIYSFSYTEHSYNTERRVTSETSFGN